MIKAFGEGRFVADPSLKNSDNGKVTFTLACHEYQGTGDEKIRYTHFLDFEAYSSGGSTILERCLKGDKLTFVARPRQNKWEVDGKKKSRIVFRLEEFTITQKYNKDA